MFNGRVLIYSGPTFHFSTCAKVNFKTFLTVFYTLFAISFIKSKDQFESNIGHSVSNMYRQSPMSFIRHSVTTLVAAFDNPNKLTNDLLVSKLIECVCFLVSSQSNTFIRITCVIFA